MMFDVAVIGLGGIGSAIAAQCAARGVSVIGLERFGPAHDRGSSHGKSRMIRQAYFEDAAYVPLVLRSYELWRELERQSGRSLLQITGVVSVGAEASEIISGTQRAAAQHGLALEKWSRAEVHRRYPSLQLLPDEVALFERDGGVLDPEQAVLAHLKRAQSAGAQLCFESTVQNWEAGDRDVTLHLGDGGRKLAKTLILSLGP